MLALPVEGAHVYIIHPASGGCTCLLTPCRWRVQMSVYTLPVELASPTTHGGRKWCFGALPVESANVYLHLGGAGCECQLRPSGGR